MTDATPVVIVAQSKVQVIEEAADKAYDKEDQAWFDKQPLDVLGVLWGLVCASPMGRSWDDEVFDALDKRGWFES